MIHVRSYLLDDRDFVLSLAPRLTIGMPAWRDPQLCLAAVQGWITGSIDQNGKKTMVFVAVDEHGERLGFVTVTTETYFTGERQAYIGELATSEEAEGRGAGKALVQTCEQWARDQGYRIISLVTGAANGRALGFYRRLGYKEEDIRLIRLLDE
ncbi:MAG: GNAT family N-acetyltransferase [Omnitrophica WOR_2 bacterium]